LPDLVGHDIGRYHIVEQLGQGGMAVCTPQDPAINPATNCTAQAIALPGVGQVSVTVTDEANAVKASALIYAYEANTYTGQAVNHA